MPTPKEKLAASLAKLEKLQRSGRRVFRSRELGRAHRERLVQQGFLAEIMRGWLHSSNPGTDPGDTTPWYASFWEFCAAYGNDRFGDDWHLSAQQSLLLHGQDTVIPNQVILHSSQGTNNTIDLPFGCSMYDLRQAQMPPARDLDRLNDLPLFSIAPALTKVPAAFFRRHPVEAQVVLSGLESSSDLTSRLLDGGHSVIAGRLAGALRRTGREDAAEDVLGAMKSAGYDVRETDPFDDEYVLGAVRVGIPPIAGRVEAVWESLRGTVEAVFPGQAHVAGDSESYLRSVDDLYQSDAYHSLSIEGYVVSPELVERVRSGHWDPERTERDRESRDALAARGYWEAFQLVKGTVERILGGDGAAPLVRDEHRAWYRALFQPAVRAGIIGATALAGYRNDAVFIRGSRHVPPRWNTVPDAMSALFDQLGSESEPGVRAVLGHWLIGYIHPYPDGNGRMARFLMNTMLASGGYPWTVIRVEDRAAYLEALEAASVGNDIEPFARFIAERVAAAMEPGT